MASPAAGNFPWSVVPEPAAGTKRWHVLRWGAAGLELNCLAVRGGGAGPAVVLMAALEGGGYPATHGLLRFASALDPHRLAGSLLVVPWIGLPGLARAFAGDGGERGDVELAASLRREVLEPADAVIELAGEPPSERWLPVAMAKADWLGLALAAGLSWAVSLRGGGRGSTPANWAAAQGARACRLVIPDVLEGRGERVELVRQGVANQLRWLGALEGQPLAVEARSARMVGVVRSPVAGFWEPAAGLGAEVERGDVLGRLREGTGVEAGVLRAVRGGVVLALTDAVWVIEGEPLARLIEVG